MINNRPILALLLLTFSSAAHAMSVSTFLAKMEGLQKNGAMALFSPDVGLLKAEGTSVGKQLREERLAALKAGRRPASCPPEKRSMKADEFIAGLRAIPPARRGISVKTAVAEMLAKKYPCPPAA